MFLNSILPKPLDVARRLTRISAFGILALPMLLGPAGQMPARAADSNTTFGRAASFTTDAGFLYSLSDDKKAFTVAFSGLVASVDTNSPEPIVARTFSFSLPIANADKGKEIPFFVSGAALCKSGANAQMVFIVNDQATVAHFSDKTNSDSFLQELKYKPGAAAELRFTIVVIASHDPRSQGAATVNVSTIDTDVLKHKR